MLPEGTKWYRVRWEKGTVIERNGKKLLWDWEHRMRTNCTARRPDLTLEDAETKVVILIDMACPNEINKEEKRTVKVRKYQQLCYEIRERREGYTVKMIPSVIGCLGGGMKQLKSDLKELFDNEKELDKTVYEMQANRLFEKYCQEYC